MILQLHVNVDQVMLFCTVNKTFAEVVVNVQEYGDVGLFIPVNGVCISIALTRLARVHDIVETKGSGLLLGVAASEHVGISYIHPLETQSQFVRLPSSYCSQDSVTPFPQIEFVTPLQVTLQLLGVPFNKPSSQDSWVVNPIHVQIIPSPQYEIFSEHPNSSHPLNCQAQSQVIPLVD
jgi:hypothetical protein